MSVEPTTCRLCGADGPDGAGAAAVAGWVTERDDAGRDRRFCPPCARRHLRAIESRLDTEWW
ncbi:hypothetical protein WIS52_24780 [Pseudonocardia nematodicida]|uniref:Small CPxCG-related zinc finger protein n=1 Tax=Pseudonocardia nematodicida TaxID=1206997 RepID=A0ABV1KHP4_9PSEU